MWQRYLMIILKASREQLQLQPASGWLAMFFPHKNKCNSEEMHLIIKFYVIFAVPLNL